MTAAVRSRDGAASIEPLLSRLRELADEVVVALDSRSVDGTESIAKRYGRVVKYEFDDEFLEGIRVMVAAARGDWILIIDDDEWLGNAWSADGLEELANDRNAMQYWFPRRWIVPPGDEYLSIAPWHPDWQGRLIRNLPGLIRYPAKLHDALATAGEHRYIPWLPLEHNKFLIADRASREARVDRYLATNPENDCTRQFLYETSYRETAPLGKTYPRIEATGLATIDASHVANVRIADAPRAMRCGEEYPLFCTIANRSRRTMTAQSEFLRTANTILTEHWFRGEVSVAGRHTFGTMHHHIPRTIEPGQEVGALVSVTAPSEPGDYLLQMDLFEENGGWFSLSDGHGEHPVAAVRVTRE